MITRKFAHSICCVLLVWGMFGCGKKNTPPDDNPARIDGIPSRISRSLVEGDTAGATVKITGTNPGNCALEMTATVTTTDGNNWLSVSSTTINAAAGAGFEIEINIDVAGPALVPGTYTGTVSLVGVCAVSGRKAIGSPAAISVNLTVTSVNAEIKLDDSLVTVDVVEPTVWTPLTPSLTVESCQRTTAVWTGYEVLVWGGTDDQGTLSTFGHLYNPDFDSWSAISTVGAPQPREFSTAIWSGTSMIV